MKDYYYILGIKRNCSVDEIKKAYRKLSLKFHPDKNDGDDFFSDRFKEILEVYEILSHPSKKTDYDFRLNNLTTDNQVNNNFIPVIEYFSADKATVEFNEEITFNWKCINSDFVEIKPFGYVKPIDSKTVRIKNFETELLNFEIIAKNTLIGKKAHAYLFIRNKTFENLKNRIIEQYEKEKFHKINPEKTKVRKQNSDENEAIGKLILWVLIIFVIGIITTFFILG